MIKLKTKFFKVDRYPSIMYPRYYQYYPRFIMSHFLLIL